MTREFSLYLDLLRLSAALVVLLSHAVGYAYGPIAWWPGSLGHNAVIVFFLLSGYVIAYVAAEKETTAREFWASRLARIYSVAVPALALTLVADAIGLALDPGFYAGGLTTGDHTLVRLAASLSFSNELWLVSIMPFSNSPYWSLCYEMAYYLLFALWCFGGAQRAWWVAAAALVVGPKILLLAPIWLLGVLLYHHRPGYRIAESLGWALWIGSMAGIALFQWLDLTESLAAWLRGQVGDWLFTRLHFSKRFIGDYLLALLIAAHFVGFRRIAGRFAVPLAACSAAIRWAASYTFSIYLFHLPLVFLFVIVFGSQPPGLPRLLLVLGCTLGITWALGSVTEQRREPLRAWLRRVLPGAPGAPAASHAIAKPGVPHA
jgi:peptidoglycan/LPS O-acetylase OafA/YrhL